MNNCQIESIGDRVFPGKYALHSRFRSVINFTGGDCLVSVVTGEVGKGPVNIVVRGIDLARLNTLRVEGDFIFLNNRPFTIAPAEIFNSRVEATTADFDGLTVNLSIFETALRELAPPGSLAFLIDSARERFFATQFEQKVAERIRGAVRVISKADPARIIEGVRQLKGIGFGLTPSGDDYIAGLLVGLNLLEQLDGVDRSALRKEIAATARSHNLLSNSFIALAADGYLFEGFKELIISLLWGHEDDIRRQTEKLVALGESSGSDMAVGFLLAIKILSRRQNFNDFSFAEAQYI
ncbi:MAG: DUF2877 domain-containing protein [Candidatus Euphemobacter frigidus]|nr:DUF2877 domain-containing protein [Candidatus Euphemobacter frigidus]